MTREEENKIDRALEMLIGLDVKVGMLMLQTSDHETRIRGVVRWRDIGALAAAAAAVSAITIAIQQAVGA